jgi:hypothetical protein
LTRQNKGKAFLRNVGYCHPETRRQLHRCDSPDFTYFTHVNSSTITDSQLPRPSCSATSDLIRSFDKRRLMTLYEVKLHNRPTGFLRILNCLVFVVCAGGSWQLPCESSEHKSRGEFLDHPLGYKDRPKGSVEHLKR